MEKILYYMYFIFSYSFLMIRYRELRKLRFNGYGIAIVGARNVIVGGDSYISYMSRIYVGANSRLVIGSGVSIGHNVRIYTKSVDYSSFVETGEKNLIESDVMIGDRVIIGGNVYIGPGVNICSGVVIGANAVVTKSITLPGAYGGVPARKIY